MGALGTTEQGEATLAVIRRLLDELEATALRAATLEQSALKANVLSERIREQDAGIARFGEKLTEARNALKKSEARREQQSEDLQEKEKATAQLIQRLDERILLLNEKLAEERLLNGRLSELERRFTSREREVENLTGNHAKGAIHDERSAELKEQVRRQDAQITALLGKLKARSAGSQNLNHALLGITGELINVAGAQTSSTQRKPLPRGTEMRDFGGLAVAFPENEPGVDYIADVIRKEAHFPLKSIQLLTLALLGRPKGVMIDVGGNVGLTAMPPVKLGLVEKVVVLEPSPANCDCLRWSLEANGLGNLVEVHQMAAGDRNGSTSFAMTRSSSLHHLDGHHPDNAESICQVQMTTLDELPSISQAAQFPWSFVKIDTQGAEVKILRGARRVLEARSAMFEIEFWPEGIRGLDDDPAEVLEVAEKYFRWVLDGKRPALGLRPISEIRELAAQIEPGRHTDFICIA